MPTVANPNIREVFKAARRVCREQGKSNPVSYALTRATDAVKLANRARSDRHAMRMHNAAVFWHCVSRSFR